MKNRSLVLLGSLFALAATISACGPELMTSSKGGIAGLGGAQLGNPNGCQATLTKHTQYGTPNDNKCVFDLVQKKFSVSLITICGNQYYQQVYLYNDLTKPCSGAASISQSSGSISQAGSQLVFSQASPSAGQYTATILDDDNQINALHVDSDPAGDVYSNQ